MRRVVAILVLIGLVSVMFGLILATRASAVTSSAPKDLMFLELTAIRRDVAGKNWTSAWAHSGKFNGHWGSHRRSHPAMSANTIANFNKLYKNLRTHLNEHSAAKVYVDLTSLRTLVVALKV